MLRSLGDPTPPPPPPKEDSIGSCPTPPTNPHPTPPAFTISFGFCHRLTMAMKHRLSALD